MKLHQQWEIQITDADHVGCLEFVGNEGDSFLVTFGGNIKRLCSADGRVLQQYTSQQSDIDCLAVCKWNDRFAAGCKDGSVVIYDTTRGDIITEFCHKNSIKSLHWNKNGLLLSASVRDIIIWGGAAKDLVEVHCKTDLSCATWNSDGSLFAAGYKSGSIVIMNVHGDTTRTLKSQLSGILNLKWIQTGDQSLLYATDSLCRIMIYDSQFKQVGDSKCKLDFKSSSIEIGWSNQYFLCKSAYNRLQLWTKDGYKVQDVAEIADAISSFTVFDKSALVGTDKGFVQLFQISFSTVHAIYQNRYAFRDCLTDVVIQDLTLHQRSRIKCRELVKKVALYQNYLVIQLSDKILVYTLQTSGQRRGDELTYVLQSKIAKQFDCNLIVVLKDILVLCMDKVLMAVDFTGSVIRQWNLDAVVRYIKAYPQESADTQSDESLLVGLKNGQVCVAHVKDANLQELYHSGHSIRCVDLNADKSVVGVVNERGDLIVVQISDKAVIYQSTSKATSIAFNTRISNQFGYSTNSKKTHIVLGSDLIETQVFDGYVVGFSGSELYHLTNDGVQTHSISQSNSLKHLLQKNDVAAASKFALQVGCSKEDYAVLKKACEKAGDQKVLQQLQGVVLHSNQGSVQSSRNFSHMTLGESSSVNLGPAVSDPLVSKTTPIAAHTVEQDEQKLRKMWNEMLYEYVMTSCKHHKNYKLLYDLCSQLDRSQYNVIKDAAQILQDGGSKQNALQLYKMISEYSKMIDICIQDGNFVEAVKYSDLVPERRDDIYYKYAFHLQSKAFYGDAVVQLRKIRSVETIQNTLSSFIKQCEALQQIGLLSKLYNELYLTELRANELNNKDLNVAGDVTRLQVIADFYHANDVMSDKRSIPLDKFRAAKWLFDNQSHCWFPQLINRSKLYAELLSLTMQVKANRYASSLSSVTPQLVLDPSYKDLVEYNSLLCRQQIKRNGLQNGGDVDDDDLCKLSCWNCANLNSICLDLKNLAQSNTLNQYQCENCGQSLVLCSSTFDSQPLTELRWDKDIKDGEALRLLQSKPPSTTRKSTTINVSKILTGQDLQSLDPSKLVISRHRSTDGSAVKLKCYMYADYNQVGSVFQCPKCERLYNKQDLELKFPKSTKPQCLVCIE
ncbi:hypothetical protein MP228_002993 [Amoeboaphelidium protococcarum]|nr:hypothetical protein MP228_002993 [Amoeboaphelidium protococcarum]